MAGKSSKKLRLVAPTKNRMAEFPSISSILEDDRLKPLFDEWSFAFVSAEAKKLAAEWKRKSSQKERVASKDEFVHEIGCIFKRYERELIQPVINGTGVILHTNLGRAPLSSLAYEELVDAVTGYSNLEFDLTEGKRSKRGLMVGRMLAALSGAEAGTAVNNNAAAVYLIVANLASGKEVVISRGQLVQIGGGFRIPDIIERSGAKLKEIGTTNKTFLKDYQMAIGKNTAMILAVHKSNFVQKGFTEEPEVSRIVELARSRRIPVCYDLGSGLIDHGAFAGRLDEPSVAAAVRTRADLVCFSGDKLLGGPQAGLIVGKQKMITALLADPLYRTFRPDKLTLGLLEKTMLGYLKGVHSLPCWEMASRSVDELRRDAENVIALINSPDVSGVSLRSSFGGGSLPEYEFDSYGIKIAGDPVMLSRRLREFATPVTSRSAAGGVLIDMRTVLPEYHSLLVDAIKSCL